MALDQLAPDGPGQLDDGANDDPHALVTTARRVGADSGAFDVHAIPRTSDATPIRPGINLHKFANRRRPNIPDGLALDESMRPAITAYDTAEADLLGALDALEAAYGTLAAARKADRAATTAAIRAGEHRRSRDDLPALTNIAEATSLVTQREMQAQAFLTVAEEAAAEVNRAFQASALTMRATAGNDLDAVDRRADAVMAELDALVAKRRSLLGGLAALDRHYVKRLVPGTTVVDPPRPADLPPEARWAPPHTTGLMLGGILGDSCAEQLSEAMAVRLDTHRRWFASVPIALDVHVVNTLNAAAASAPAPAVEGTGRGEPDPTPPRRRGGRPTAA